MEGYFSMPKTFTQTRDSVIVAYAHGIATGATIALAVTFFLGAR